MNFPYVEFLGLAEERVFRPMIPVTFRNNKEEFRSYALIDSGADHTILPIEIAGILKIELSHQHSFNVESAGGNTFKVYKSPTEIESIIQKKGFRDIKWKSDFYFA